MWAVFVLYVILLWGLILHHKTHGLHTKSTLGSCEKQLLRCGPRSPTTHIVLCGRRRVNFNSDLWLDSQSTPATGKPLRGLPKSCCGREISGLVPSSSSVINKGGSCGPDISPMLDFRLSISAMRKLDKRLSRNSFRLASLCFYLWTKFRGFRKKSSKMNCLSNAFLQ